MLCEGGENNLKISLPRNAGQTDYTDIHKASQRLNTKDIQ
jgi:hypothetical protein